MTTIYLWVLNEGWKPFELENCKEELTTRSIVIFDSAKIGHYAEIGDSAKIGHYAEIGDSAKIGHYAEIGHSAEIGDREVIVKSLFIKGTKHTIYWWGKGVINIGCHKKTINEWKDVYESIGEDENYSEKEIEEYYGYIIMIEQLQANTVIELVAEKAEVPQ